jgi:hypothetical protein
VLPCSSFQPFIFSHNAMKIKIKEGLPEMANVGISSMAVVLKDVFLVYGQFHDIEDAEKVSDGQVIMPIVAYEKKRINLKTTPVRNTFCNARFAVFSKDPKSPRTCARFIWKKRHIDKQTLIDQMPTSLREGTLDNDGMLPLINLLSILENIESDRVAFFYVPMPAEGYVTHCIAVIHEFGPEEDPYAVATAYLSVEMNK